MWPVRGDASWRSPIDRNWTLRRRDGGAAFELTSIGALAVDARVVG